MMRKASSLALYKQSLFSASSKGINEVFSIQETAQIAAFNGLQNATMAMQAASTSSPKVGQGYKANQSADLFNRSANNINKAAAILSKREPFARHISTSIVKAGAAVAEAGPVKEEDIFALPIRYLHWLMAAGIISVITLVQLARNTEDKAAKGYYMMLHKSIGFTLGFFAAARIFYRLSTPIPKMLEGPVWEQYAAAAVHYGFYGLMVYMPFSGILMGYFGGKGIPFFGLTIPGAPEGYRRGDIAKFSFQTHKLAGQVFYYVLPLHVGAAFFHQYYKGQRIFARVNPLLKLSSA
eukprot:TRINITY_DN3439_c1_g1_i1.p1 TRINITY_DN3439_c1_g1~~TRINITY_DN3439_c1_g1_i1.p1  ORF type:complete len:295 (-),score=31.16 TRINITY_DN3439_c1_g1_i1:274-1158(-)